MKSLSPKVEAISGGVIHLVGLVVVLVGAGQISPEVLMMVSGLVLMLQGHLMWREGVKRDDQEQMEALLAERDDATPALMEWGVAGPPETRENL